LGFNPTNFNAEFINDFFPFEIIPDVLVMNPPFSSSGGRTINNSSKFGFRHVDSALERLKKGGKFGIILGNSAGLSTKTGREFWRKIPLNLQAKLLKAVEEKRIRRVGSNTERVVDTRIVAATSQDLKRMVAKGRFRADLYDRLNILNLETVPLKFQREKIKDLLVSGLESECEAAGRAQPFEISDEAARLVQMQDWLGNFRELNNFVTRLAVECLDDSIILEDSVRRVLSERIKPRISNETAQLSMPAASGTIRHDYQSSEEDDLITVTFDPKFDDLDAVYLKAAASVILHVLAENDGSLRRAASKLGATHSTLTRILQKFDSIYGTVSLHSHLDTVQNFAAVA
jgi:DNA-binding NtrC family response regulator